jgi:hypothetical protein
MRQSVRRCGLVLCALLLAAPPARATDEKDIKAVIGRGVRYLKRAQRVDGIWPCVGIVAITPEASPGLTALATLALVECDVPVTDPAVLKGAAAVRQASPGLTKAYCLALSIMLLDRIGDPDDEPLIQAMGVRLLAGQTTAGTWPYDCPLVGGLSEVRRLTAIAQQKNLLIAKGEMPRPVPKGTDKRREMAPEIRDQLALMTRLGYPVRQPAGDNSVTQFAILGLWAARRHGIPVGRALEVTEMHFRDTQNSSDYGWGYAPPDVGRSNKMESTPQMTCAGLLGLALGHGAAGEAVLRADPKGGKEAKPAKGPRRWDPARDRAIRFGLAAVGTAIGHPVAKGTHGWAPIRGRAEGRAYYFLWSLERVALAFGLETIGQKDWHTWGAEILHVSQNANGSWEGDYGGVADTSFALLFLRKANLATDLSDLLKGKVEDPRTVRLKVGGVGGDTMAKGLKPGVRLTEAPASEPPGRDKPAQSKGLDAEIGRLSKALVQAPPAQRDKLLGTYKTSPGAEYTDALAMAIPQLTAPAQAQVRDVLTERLALMTAATLHEKLRDADGEIRRAAARACAMRDEREHVPELIRLLEDPEPPVARAAHTALKALTGQDFGPLKDARRAERTKAIAAWKAWWQSNGGK